MITFGILYVVCGVLYIIGCCFEDKELRKNVANRLYQAPPVIKPVYIEPKLQRIVAQMEISEMDMYYHKKTAEINAISKCAYILLEKVRSQILVTKAQPYSNYQTFVRCELQVKEPDITRMPKGIEYHVGVPSDRELWETKNRAAEEELRKRLNLKQ